MRMFGVCREGHSPIHIGLVFIGVFSWFASSRGLQAVPPSATKPASEAGIEPRSTPPATVEKIASASAEGRQAMGGFRKPAGWQVAEFASEPDVANPVAIYVDRLSRVFVCESFRQDNGVTDNRGHDQDWLHADLAAQTVADRIAYHQKLLGARATEYTEHDDRIRLLVDTNGDQVADRATVFAAGFNRLEDGSGAGVLEHNGDIFFTCIPKLWRLRDRDQDGVAEQREALYDGFGVRVAFRGHDMHGLVIGPDGRLYFSIGDRGYHVKTSHEVLANPESGAVFRCELDGSNLEIFASGLRNPQELAFDDQGNLFTGDNNSDSGDKARWVNVLEGGDTGWRMMYQYISDRGPFNREKIWQPYSADTPAYIVPPIDNIADGPSGLTYYPGTGAGDDLLGCFLLADFRGGSSNSGIRAIKVKPKGAFWEIERNTQMFWNILATDVDFGPDGALWVSDWVDGWKGLGKGRIYRFFNPAAQQQSIVAEVEQLLRAGFQDLPTDKLGALLIHRDRRIRLGAQWELAARRAIEPLMQLLADTQADALGRLHAVWGLAQVARLDTKSHPRVIGPLRSALQDDDAALRAAAIQGLADARLAASDQASIEQSLVQLLGDREAKVRYQAAVACGKLHVAGAFEPICQLISANADIDPAIRHAGIMALSGMPGTSAVVDLSKHDSRSVRLAAVVALRKNQDPRVAVFLSDVDVGVRLEAARAINDVTALHGGLPTLAALAGDTRQMPDPLLHRVLNANFRLGMADNAAAIAAIAIDSRRSSEMRTEALEMLRVWGTPGDLDRVMNRYQPLAERDPQVARQALSAVLPQALQTTGALKTLVLSVAAELGVKEVAASLRAVAEDTQQSVEARVPAIHSIVRLDPQLAGPLMVALAKDAEPRVRAAAVQHLASSEPSLALPLLEQAIRSDQSIERQMAWDALGTVDDPRAVALISAALVDYQNGKLPADVWLNVLEASEGRVSREAQAALAAFEASEAAKDPLAAYRDCISGGDPEAGEQIFTTRAELSCVRCHRVGNNGGEVGPALTDIAKTKDSRYLLEAIVNPDAKIAENFETTVILTEDDEVLTGIVKQESGEQVSLITPEGKVIDIAKADIAVRKKGKSSMPSDLTKHMTRRQLRDLVAYLSSLKGARRNQRPRD